MKTWKLNLILTQNQLWIFLIHSLFTLVVFGLNIIPGLIEKSVFDRLTGSAQAGVDLWGLIALYAGVEVARLAAALGAEWYAWTFRLLNEALLRRNIFASILNRRRDTPLPVSPGEAINRLRNDVAEVTDFPLWIPDQVGKILAAIVAVVIMARINLTITLVIFLPLFAILGLTRLAWDRIILYNRARTQATDAVTGFLGEIFSAVQAVKIANAEQRVANHFLQLNQKRQEAAVNENVFGILLNSINSSTVTFGVAVMLFLASQAISNGSFSVGDFALFTSYLLFTTQVPSELGTFSGDYKTQAVSIERLLEMVRPEPAFALVESHPVYEKDPIPPLKFVSKNGDHKLDQLEVRGLTYHYPDSQQGIEEVSFIIDRGSLTVVTGRIGSGKSTLLRVLMGLLPVEAGEVCWNGEPIQDLDQFLRPPRSAYTSQVPRLFSETLRDNILAGFPEEQANLPEALRRSVFEQDLAAMPAGLDTLVGPRGVRLSGGQVQRVAAARMLVRQPELLVIDDLSSALDVETEKLLWDRLDDGIEKFTSLVVSHRKTVLSRADQIVILKDGHVEAQGKLNDLLEHCEEMRHLWKGEI